MACRRALLRGRLAWPPTIPTTSGPFSETNPRVPAARSKKIICANTLDSSRVRPVGVAHRLFCWNPLTAGTGTARNVAAGAVAAGAAAAGAAATGAVAAETVADGAAAAGTAVAGAVAAGTAAAGIVAAGTVAVGAAAAKTAAFGTQDVAAQGKYLALVLGPFGQISLHASDVVDLVAQSRALLMMRHRKIKAENAYGLCRAPVVSRIGLAGSLGWVRLILDRFRDAVCPHPDSSSSFIDLGADEFNFESFGSQRRSDRGFRREC